MSNKIEFVSEREGKIEMFLQDGTALPLTDDPKIIASAVDCHGAEGYFTSSMDFASEYGFASNELAKELWDKGMWLYFEKYA